jgi:hypothetical protein
MIFPKGSLSQIIEPLMERDGFGDSRCAIKAIFAKNKKEILAISSSMIPI